MFNTRRQLLCCTLFAAAGLSVCISASAQEFPNKTLTIVVPFSAGGGVDTIARLLAEKLRASLKQNIVVDNKAGGSGMIGAMAVVKAAPDGYTLLLGSAGETAINAFVYKNKMQYSPSKDLAPITLVTRIPNVLVVNPTFPAKNIEELVAYAKKNPGKVSYSTSGVGNPQHLNGELLEELAGIHMVHIPYKGAAGQLIDVVSGNVEMTFVSYTAAKAFIKDGKVKAIAVTSAKRTSFAPDIAAIAEYKPLASYQLDNWFGLFAPAGTPEPILTKLRAAMAQVMAAPDVQELFAKSGGQVPKTSAAEQEAKVASDIERWTKLIREAGVKGD